MAYSPRSTQRKRGKSNPKSRRKRRSLQKPNGVISPRVEKVGGARFAIVCVDPAKYRSEWMMADYFGNVLIEPQTLEHRGACFKLVVEQIRQAQQAHDIQDMIVVVERTGNYHLPSKRAFAAAGFETRVVHPFATKQYRVPADPGNKTDETDLYAQHRAAVAGFGLRECELESPYRELRFQVRHRRNLVERASALACQIRDHLHLALPGYADLFDRFFERPPVIAIARRCDSPEMMLQLGEVGLRQYLKENKIHHRQRTIDRVLAWAAQATGGHIPDRPIQRAIWTDLYDLYEHFQRKVAALEQRLASDLVRTPYVRLLAMPGINVVSAAELAGEMGPINGYANANAITGRCGLFPSRYQSDQKDHDSGRMIRQANRRLRAVLMRVADNLACHCNYYRGQIELDQSRGVDKRLSHVKIAKRFSRLLIACVAGNEPMKHPAFQQPDSIFEKIRHFHHDHETPVSGLMEDLHVAVGQLPYNTRQREAQVVAAVLEKQTARHRGGVAIGELLPAVLARLGITPTDNKENGDRS